MQSRPNNCRVSEKKSISKPYRLSIIITSLLLSIAILIGFSFTGFSGVSVAPLLLDLTMSPGSSGTGTLTVSNTGKEPIQIESQVRGFRTSTRGVAHFLSESAAEEYLYSGENFLTLKPDKAVLEPLESKEFTYEVSYPNNPEPFGGRYVGALFQSTPVEEKQDENGGSNIKVATRVGTLFLIRPSEEILVGDEFLEFEVKPEIKELTTSNVYGGDRLLISTHLKNSGNIHIRKKEFDATISINGPSGELVEEIEISPHYILPDTSYMLKELWKIPGDIDDEELRKHTVKVRIGIKTPYGNIVEIEESRPVEIEI
ncbi:MAG: hypothetical protein ACOC6I_01990 [Candidatus Bipolaricaulota bacterium]